MRSRVAVGILLLAGNLASCGLQEGSETGRGSEPLSDQGTSLSATAELGSMDCDTGGNTAQITLITTGAVDSVSVTESVNGGAPVQISMIFSHEFQRYEGGPPRNKRVVFETELLPLSLGNSHEVELCFRQHGRRKMTCAAPFDVDMTSCDNGAQCPGEPTFGITGDLCADTELQVQIENVAYSADLSLTAGGEVLSVAPGAGCTVEALWDYSGDIMLLEEFTLTLSQGATVVAEVTQTFGCEED